MRVAGAAANQVCMSKFFCGVTSALWIRFGQKLFCLTQSGNSYLNSDVWRQLPCWSMQSCRAIIWPLESFAVRCGSPNSYWPQKSDYESGVVRRIYDIGCVECYWRGHRATQQSLSCHVSSTLLCSCGKVVARIVGVQPRLTCIAIFRGRVMLVAA